MKSNLLSLRNILFIVILVILATWFVMIGAQLIANPSTLKGVDYVAIYPAGYIAHYEGLSQVYRSDLQQQVENAVTYPAQLVRFYPYNHPPFLIRILQLITTSDYVSSFYRWLIILLMFHLLSLLLLFLLLQSSGWAKTETWIMVISGLFFYPIFNSFLKGQDSAFLLLGVTIWTYGLLTGKDRIAGLGLVLSAIRPQIALVLALPFLFKRRKVWWWFIAWGFIFLAYFYLLIGFQGIMDFIRLLVLSGGGIDVDKMPTLMGALLRSFPGISPKLLLAIGYSAYGLVLLFLALVWAKSRVIVFKHIGLAVLLSIIFSPHLHIHDLSLLLIPILGTVVVLAEYKFLTRETAALLPLGVSVLLAIIAVFWAYPLYYLLSLLLGLLLWVPGWLKPARNELIA